MGMRSLVGMVSGIVRTGYAAKQGQTELER